LRHSTQAPVTQKGPTALPLQAVLLLHEPQTWLTQPCPGPQSPASRHSTHAPVTQKGPVLLLVQLALPLQAPQLLPTQPWPALQLPASRHCTQLPPLQNGPEALLVQLAAPLHAVHVLLTQPLVPLQLPASRHCTHAPLEVLQTNEPWLLHADAVTAVHGLQVSSRAQTGALSGQLASELMQATHWPFLPRALVSSQKRALPGLLPNSALQNESPPLASQALIQAPALQLGADAGHCESALQTHVPLGRSQVGLVGSVQSLSAPHAAQKL
jgi:hypothetical protein